MIRQSHCIALGMAVLLGTATRDCDAQGASVTAQMEKMAREIQLFLRGQGTSEIVIGQFRAPPQLATNSGPGLAKELKDELKKLGVRVVSVAKFAVDGKLRLVPPQARVSAEIVDSNGDVQLALRQSVELSKIEDLIAVLSPSARVAPDATVSERIETVLVSAKNPRIDIAETKIRSDPRSPYSIEVLHYPDKVAPGQAPTELPYEPCVAASRGGRAFVDLEIGWVYAIRVTNGSEYEAAVGLQVDGLSMFEFNDDGYQHMIVPAGKSTVIYGWFIDPQRSAYFEISRFANAEAQVLKKSSTNMGVITATFRAAWEEEAEPPADEKFAKFTARGDKGTKKGLEFKKEYSIIRRETGVIRDVISVRYDQ